jgi:hypothetical protein
MPNTNCPACNQQVGDHAHICPHCGCVLERSQSRKQAVIGLVVTFGLLAVTVGMINSLFSESYRQFEKANQQQESTPYSQTCQDQPTSAAETMQSCRAASLESLQMLK